MPHFNKVLITRFSALGDVAMTVPQVYSVCRAYPDITFVMLTQKVASSLFINAPHNLQVYVAHIYDKHKGIVGLYRLARELNELGIDAVIDLHDVMRSQFLRLLLRIMGRPVFIIDKGRRDKKRLVATKNKVFEQLKSSAQRYADTISQAGLPYQQSFTSLYPEAKAPVETFAHITSPKSAGTKWIGIAPFAKHNGKIYPLDYMECVVKQLSKLDDTHLFLFGAGSEEAKVLGSWRDKYNNVTSLADRRNGFPVELALISHLDVMVSMDSANMHLAALTNTPVITIWGATHRYAGFLGYNVSLQLIIEDDMPCRPCSVFGNKPCHRGDYACMRNISPQRVIDKIKETIY